MALGLLEGVFSQIDLDCLDAARTLDDVSNFVNLARDRMGLSHCTYHCPTLRGYSNENPLLLLTYADDWVEHYKRAQYVRIDPVVSVSARSMLPIDWSKLDRTRPKVRRLFNESIDAGVGRQGLTVPIRGPVHGMWALMSITTNDTEREWSLRRDQFKKEALLLAYCVHEAVVRIQNETPVIDLNLITRRECETLSWIAEGKTIDDVGVILGISNETVKAHLDSARAKLSALNRPHAVAKALRMGLIC
ncbi:MAG: LuxR family transcriptional regulator [Rhodoblastus sp.]|nr:LuxR family transcriptional regulator [Rhodoblastus sp.]